MPSCRLITRAFDLVIMALGSRKTWLGLGLGLGLGLVIALGSRKTCRPHEVRRVGRKVPRFVPRLVPTLPSCQAVAGADGGATAPYMPQPHTWRSERPGSPLERVERRPTLRAHPTRSGCLAVALARHQDGASQRATPTLTPAPTSFSTCRADPNPNPSP